MVQFYSPLGIWHVFYIVLTPIYSASGLWSTGNTRKYQQIDVYIYQCEDANSPSQLNGIGKIWIVFVTTYFTIQVTLKRTMMTLRSSHFCSLQTTQTGFQKMRLVCLHLVMWMDWCNLELISTDFHFNNIWAATWEFHQCGMCDQQRLRPVCVYTQSDKSLC